MHIQEIMTKSPTCCTPDTTLQAVAKLMCDCDCGEIPVVENQQNLKPVGVITDRDITCRAVARGKNPLLLTARDCMTAPVVTARPETKVEECCQMMEKHQIRRLLIVDQKGACCGIVAQADLAIHAPEQEANQFLREISEPVRNRSMASAR